MNENQSSTGGITVDIEKLDPEIVSYALDEGKLLLESQSKSIDSTQRKVITILGWIIAALISLIGILVKQVASGSPQNVAFWMNLYGIIALAIPATLILFGVLFNVETYLPGNEPANTLDETVINWVNSRRRETRKIDLLKLSNLQMVQACCSANNKTIKRLVIFYRMGIASLLLLILGGVILLYFLSF
ncbi:MAG: hypothetical protein IJK48_09240 [Bacteroidales bacterium]|nr:hypothetical protein [Bacteroidales bacterium]